MTDAGGRLDDGAAAAADDGARIPPEAAAPDDGPVGLWASGRARYQQGGYSEPMFLPLAAGGTSARQGTWRSGGYRSSHVRAWITVFLVGLVTALNGAVALIFVADLVLWDDLVNGRVPVSTVDALDGTQMALAVLAGVGYLVGAVFLLAWLSRVIDNIPPLTGRTPVRSPREAIGWWFVPIANLWIPFTIVRDAALFLDPRGRGTGLVGWWWILLISERFAGSFATQLGRGATELPDIQAAIYLGLGNGLLGIAAGVLLVLVIHRVERWAKVRAAEIAVQPLMYPGGPARSELVTPNPAWGSAAAATGAAAPAPAPSPAREYVILTATAEGPAAPPPPPPV